MRIINFFTIAFLFPLLGFANGGGQLGNGADAIVCTIGYKTTVELLDIYEARIQFQKKWAFDYRGGTAIEASTIIGVGKILAELDEKLPLKTKRLRQYLNTFFDEAVFLDGVELTDIPDSLQVAIPGGCKLAQLVIQNSNPTMGQKRYTVNKDLWTLMDPTSRMGMVLHEIIYRDQVILGDKDSRWTRYFNALLFSNTIKTMSPEEIKKVIQDVSKPTFIKNGLILQGELSDDQDIYQIIAAENSSVVPKEMVDGRFSMKENRVLDYTATNATEIFDVITNTVYSLELLSDTEISKAYLTSGKTSDSLLLSPRRFSDFDYASIQINGLNSDGSILIEKRTTIVTGKFNNGVDIESHDSSGLKKGMEIDSWLASKSCPTDTVCYFLSSLSFANGYGSARGEIYLNYSGKQLINMSAMDERFNYCIPKESDPSLNYSFDPMPVNFKTNGDFSFQYETSLWPSFFVKLVTRDGLVIQLAERTRYLLEFDLDGYLLKATEIPLISFH